MAEKGQWRSWAEIADVFQAPADTDWERDQDQLDAAVGGCPDGDETAEARWGHDEQPTARD